MYNVMRCFLLILGCIMLACAADLHAFDLKIPAIVEQRIPVFYTCDGENSSPAIFWSGEPKETKSYVLIVSDKDARSEASSFDGRFIHWIIYNIPPKLNHLPKGVSKDKTLPNGTMQGKNSFHRMGYDGPCPPPNQLHHYVFSLFALDTMLKIRPGATTEELQKAMQGHIIGKAEFVGTYQQSS